MRTTPAEDKAVPSFLRQTQNQRHTLRRCLDGMMQRCTRDDNQFNVDQDDLCINLLWSTSIPVWKYMPIWIPICPILRCRKNGTQPQRNFSDGYWERIAECDVLVLVWLANPPLFVNPNRLPLSICRRCCEWRACNPN